MPRLLEPIICVFDKRRPGLTRIDNLHCHFRTNASEKFVEFKITNGLGRERVLTKSKQQKYASSVKSTVAGKIDQGLIDVRTAFIWLKKARNADYT